MTYKVEITPSAERNFDEAVDWIIKNSSAQVAALWLDSLIKRVDGLAHMPTRFGFAPENRLFEMGDLRQFTYYSHRVIYHIQDTSVRILHVRHGRQEFLRRSQPGK